MRSIYKVFFILMLFAGFAKTAEASHNVGGEITWECQPNGQYKFILILYRECAGIDLGPTQQINGPVSFTVTRDSVLDITPTCNGTRVNCATATSANSGEGAIDMHVYSATVSLSGVPPANGWVFTWTQCCRPGSVVNTNSGGYVVRAKMYPYTPPGATAPLNTNNCFDSSPYFEELGALTQIKGTPFTYNHLAADKDIDSLFVKFADPWQAMNTSVVWNAGYSTTAPFPNPAVDPAHGPITIDGTTGAISMDVANNAPQGSYASCFAIEAWRYGQNGTTVGPQLIAEVFRDVGIIFRDYDPSTACNPNGPQNNQPDALIDTSVYVNINRLSDNIYQTSVYPGDTIDFEFSATDFDQNSNCSFQNITFQAVGLQVNADNMRSSNGCNGVSPCATFSWGQGQTGFTSPLNNDVNFFWVPDCQHLTSGGFFWNTSSRFYFAFRMEDDNCPAPEISLTTFIVDVIIGDPQPINFGCLEQTAEGGDIRLQWERSRQDSALEFNDYVILASANRGGPYDTIQYISDIDSLSTIVSGTSNYEHFYIQKSTGKCDFFSRPSDTLSIMDLTLTATPPNNAEVADLSWTEIAPEFPKFTTQIYEVWAEAPANSGNWVKVGETDQTIFSDTVTVCGDTVNYQIRVQDTLNNCGSFSDIESAYFSDQTNNDRLVIDSVSVNTNGNSIISWDSTAYGDVVAYYLYFNDPKLGWTIVDTIPRGTAMPWEWTASQASGRAEEFRVSSVDSCDNQSDYETVKPHKSVHMNVYINKCEGFNRLAWNAYQGWGSNGVAGYEILANTTDANGNSSGYQVIATRDAEDSVFVQNNLVNGTTYCYRVRAVDTAGIHTSTSNESCVFAEVPRKSKVLYLAQVTYDENRDVLALNTLVDGDADVMNFTIERAPSAEGPWQNLGKVGKPAQAPYRFNFLDYGAASESKEYFYRVSATDSCGGRDTISNLGRNILLRVDDRPNLTNLLRWNPYQEWGGEVGAYSIYRKGPEEDQYSKVSDVIGGDTSFVDDVADYRNTEGGFCYFVVANESNNPEGYVAPDGLPYSSRSNTECMNQRAKVFMPTAFRPGSDYSENRTFGPSARFVDIEEYTFYVMNRWGVKVFETNDPEDRWDGTENSEPAAQGTYIYYLRYSTPDGSTEEQRGSVVLIR